MNICHQLSVRYDMLTGNFRRYETGSLVLKFIGIMSRLFIDCLNCIADFNVKIYIITWEVVVVSI